MCCPHEDRSVSSGSLNCLVDERKHVFKRVRMAREPAGLAFNIVMCLDANMYIYLYMHSFIATITLITQESSIGEEIAKQANYYTLKRTYLEGHFRCLQYYNIGLASECRKIETEVGEEWREGGTPNIMVFFDVR